MSATAERTPATPGLLLTEAISDQRVRGITIFSVFQLSESMTVIWHDSCYFCLLCPNVCIRERECEEKQRERGERCEKKETERKKIE